MPAIRRPSLMGIFLGFLLVFLGGVLTVKSAIRLLEDDYGLQQALDAAVVQRISSETNPDRERRLRQARRNLNDAMEQMGDEFSPTQLAREADARELFMHSKVHQLAALCCGLLCLLAGLPATAANAWSWRRAQVTVVSAGTVIRPGRTCVFIGWFSTIMGALMLAPSVYALRELWRYKNEAKVTTLFNMATMSRLAEHYLFLLCIASGLFLCGAFTVILHAMASRRARRLAGG